MVRGLGRADCGGILLLGNVETQLSSDCALCAIIVVPISTQTKLVHHLCLQCAMLTKHKH